MQDYDPNNLTHVMLRRNDDRMKKVVHLVERMSHDMHDVKVRLTGIEEGLAGVNRRIDRVEERLEHLEVRAGLVGSEFAETAEPFRGPET